MFQTTKTKTQDRLISLCLAKTVIFSLFKNKFGGHPIYTENLATMITTLLFMKSKKGLFMCYFQKQNIIHYL